MKKIMDKITTHKALLLTLLLVVGAIVVILATQRNNLSIFEGNSAEADWGQKDLETIEQSIEERLSADKNTSLENVEIVDLDNKEENTSLDLVFTVDFRTEQDYLYTRRYESCFKYSSTDGQSNIEIKCSFIEVIDRDDFNSKLENITDRNILMFPEYLSEDEIKNILDITSQYFEDEEVESETHKIYKVNDISYSDEGSNIGLTTLVKRKMADGKTVNHTLGIVVAKNGSEWEFVRVQFMP